MRTPPSCTPTPPSCTPTPPTTLTTTITITLNTQGGCTAPPAPGSYFIELPNPMPGLPQICKVSMSPYWKNQTALRALMYRQRLPDLAPPPSIGRAGRPNPNGPNSINSQRSPHGSLPPRCLPVIAPAVQPSEWPLPGTPCPKGTASEGGANASEGGQGPQVVDGGEGPSANMSASSVNGR